MSFDQYHFVFVGIAGILNFLQHQSNNRDDKNLEEILETESILTEAKNGNQDLLSYLLRPEIFNQLLSYVTKVPNHYTEAGFDTSQCLKGNKSTKYPYNVCELLSSDIDKIANYMLGLNN